MKTKGVLFTIASAICFGITPLLATAIYALGANALTVVFYRSLLVLPILYGLMKVHHVSLSMAFLDVCKVAVIAIFGSGLTTILLFSSYTYIDVGTATTLHFLYPVIVSLFCLLLYHEHLGRAKLFALSLAFLGVLCFFDFTQMKHIIGILLALSSAITYAFYMVQMEKSGLSHHNAYQISFYLAIFIVIETLVYHCIQPQIHFLLPLSAYGLLVLLAILSSFLAVVLLQLGIKYLGSSTASLFCLFEPITSIICGTIFLHEELTLLKLIGCFIIFSSLILMSAAEQAKQRKHQEELKKQEKG